MNEYLESVKKRDPAAKSILSIILTYPGVKAVFMHKISNFFHIAGFLLIARIISQVTRFFTGIEIHPGAKIGKNCIIGSKALVTEGMDIPDGSMVLGIPGKIKKTLSEEEQSLVPLGAEHYIENYKKFKKLMNSNEN